MPDEEPLSDPDGMAKSGDGERLADAEALFQQLAAFERSKGRRELTRKKLLRFTVLAVALLAAGTVLVMEHEISQNFSGPGTNSSASLTESDLNAGLGFVREFVAAKSAKPDSAGLLSGLPLSADNLTFGPYSDAPSLIAVDESRPGAIVVVSLALEPPECFGVLDVLSTQPGPVFPGHPATEAIGTYYFEAPVTSPLICTAASVAPPPGSQYVSTQGYPAASLPPSS